MAKLCMRWDHQGRLVYHEEDDVVHVDLRYADTRSRLTIVGDIQPFVSSVDRSIIHGRADLREHNKRHGVTFTEDFKGEWEVAAKRREEFKNGTYASPGIRESLEREFYRRSN